MARRIIRWVILSVIRFFHRQIAVRGAENIPESGAALVVANHPNGLVDPAVIRLALEREVGFMAKAPLFENLFFNLCMDAFAALPVYRSKDGADTAANQKTFQAVQRRFDQNRWVVIFPEGHSHSEPTLQKLKTGAARIALGYEQSDASVTRPVVLPVGLVYEDKESFRSRVAVVIGAPIETSRYVAEPGEDPWTPVVRLTTDISNALSALMLEADSAENWRGFLAVARWTTPNAARDVAACEARAKQLARAYRVLVAEDPERAEALAEQARHFVRMLEVIGVEDPLSLERPTAPPVGRLVRDVLTIALATPVALVGWLLNALPYYAIRPLAARVAGTESDIVSSVKTLAGLLFYPLMWLIWAAAATYLWSWPVGLAPLVAGPLTGMVAVRFFEVLALRREAMVGAWLRVTRRNVVEAIVQRRAELVSDIEAALSVSSPVSPSGE